MAGIPRLASPPNPRRGTVRLSFNFDLKNRESWYTVALEKGPSIALRNPGFEMLEVYLFTVSSLKLAGPE